jgi:DNA-binding IclR family transcriptional regulator
MRREPSPSSPTQVASLVADLEPILDETASSESNSSVRAVERALQLIEVFARSRGPLSITDLARTLELAPSTVHRLVQTLMALGYVVQYAESKRYGVGRGIAEVTRTMVLKYEFTRHAQPFLERLVEQTGETASLSALYGPSAIYLNQAESRNVMRVSNGVGSLVPLHCTAIGKVFLADFAPRTLRDTLKHTGLEAMTAHSITSRKLLDKELESVKRQGYAMDDEEFAIGARCIATPLRGSSGTVIAAISLSAPSSRLPLERVPEFAALLRETADEFARQLRRP